MRNLAEVVGQISIDHLVMSPLKQSLRSDDRLLGTPPRSIAVLSGSRSASKIGSNTNNAELCATRSRMHSMPNGRYFPACFLGIRTCLTTCRASHVASFFLFHACRRHYLGGSQGVPASLASHDGSGFPRFSVEAAHASPVSKPARRSLAFRPAWSLSRSLRPLDTRGLQSKSLPP